VHRRWQLLSIDVGTVTSLTGRRLVLLLAGLSFLAGCMQADSGTSTVPATATSAVLETTTSSTTVVHTAETQPGSLVSCPGPIEGSAEVRGDLDGDGAEETVLVERPPGGETVIRVCGSRLRVAPYHVGDVNKPVEVYGIDIEGDGITELLVGAPTGAGPFAGTVLRLEGDELVDTRLSLTVIFAGREGSSFGCVDVDGDGVRELVSYTYEFDGDTVDSSTTMTWARTVLLGPLTGTTTTGTFDVGEQREDVEVLMAGTCGDDVDIRAYP